MANIIYTPNNWQKGNVLTAEKLNADELALQTVINKINGAVIDGDGNTTGTLSDEDIIINKQALTTTINNLDYVVNNESEENKKPGVLKTVMSLTQEDGIINPIYQEIQKANGENFGVIKAGTNLSATNGTLNVIDNPIFSGKLTASADVEFGTETTIENNTSYSTATLNANTTINGTATLQGITAINNNTTITGTVSMGTNNNGDYSIAKFDGVSNIIKGTTNRLNNLTVGTATTENETTTYAGTTIFNTQTNTFNGTTTFNDITFNGSLTFGSNAQVPWNKLINIPTATTIYTDNVITGSTGGIISAQDKSRLDQLYELTHNATNNSGKLLVMNGTSGEAEWQSIYDSIPAATSSARGLMDDYQYSYLEGIIKIFKINAGQLAIDQERSNPDAYHKYYPIYQLTLTSASDNNLTKNITAESIEEIENILPLGDLPTTDGTYNLQVEHIDDDIVYSWVPIT